VTGSACTAGLPCSCIGTTAQHQPCMTCYNATEKPHSRSLRTPLASQVPMCVLSA
jgi:hypothetical protein